MGMRIGGGGGGWANYQNSTSINAHQQRQHGARNLMSALQSGDLNAAQTAFTAMQNQGLPANSPFNAVGQALQSGDLASAQKAAQSIMAARSQRMQGNDGDGDDAASQASAASAASTTASTSTTQSVDPSVAFTAFMQNLESALEQQNPNSTTQTTAAATGTTTPSTQAVLWSRDGGFSQTTSDATLKADLDSLIQQLTSGSTTDPTATTSTTTAAAATTTATSAPATPTAASALQSSFANLIGSMGGQSSSASVMNFLQGLDSSLTASTASSLNISA